MTLDDEEDWDEEEEFLGDEDEGDDHADFDDETDDVGFDDDDVERGDDLCDLCFRSGVAVYRTTRDGRTVCEDDACQTAADEIDAAIEEEE